MGLARTDHQLTPKNRDFFHVDSLATFASLGKRKKTRFFRVRAFSRPIRVVRFAGKKNSLFRLRRKKSRREKKRDFFGLRRVEPASKLDHPDAGRIWRGVRGGRCPANRQERPPAFALRILRGHHAQRSLPRRDAISERLDGFQWQSADQPPRGDHVRLAG